MYGWLLVSENYFIHKNLFNAKMVIDAGVCRLFCIFSIVEN